MREHRHRCTYTNTHMHTHTHTHAHMHTSSAIISLYVQIPFCWGPSQFCFVSLSMLFSVFLFPSHALSLSLSHCPRSHLFSRVRLDCASLLCPFFTVSSFIVVSYALPLSPLPSSLLTLALCIPLFSCAPSLAFCLDHSLGISLSVSFHPSAAEVVCCRCRTRDQRT